MRPSGALTRQRLGILNSSGGAISQLESEPTFQLGVQTTGYRTTPDVSLVADPATGVWVADLYNQSAGNPWQAMGGTSLSAPLWAGLVALANQGRASALEAPLNSASPTDTQTALYSLPRSDYHVISSGTNGFGAAAGFNLAAGLGTPIVNLLVPALIAWSGTSDPSGPTVARPANADLASSARWLCRSDQLDQSIQCVAHDAPCRLASTGLGGESRFRGGELYGF